MALIITMGVLVLPVKTINISQSKEMGIMTSKFDAVLSWFVSSLFFIVTPPCHVAFHINYILP